MRVLPAVKDKKDPRANQTKRNREEKSPGMSDGRYWDALDFDELDRGTWDQGGGRGRETEDARVRERQSRARARAHELARGRQMFSDFE